MERALLGFCLNLLRAYRFDVHATSTVCIPQAKMPLATITSAAWLSIIMLLSPDYSVGYSVFQFFIDWMTKTRKWAVRTIRLLEHMLLCGTETARTRRNESV